MTRLDLDGLDGSLMVPAGNPDAAYLAVPESTQDSEQLAPLEFGDSKTVNLSAYSDSFPSAEPRHEGAGKTENDSDIEHSKDPLLYDDTELLLVENAECDVNGDSPSKNLRSQKFISTPKAGNKAPTENDFDQVDANNAVVPAFKDKLIPDSAAVDIASPPQSQTAPRLRRLLTISAVFVAGILIGGASLLAWLSIDKKPVFVSLIDTPSDPILQHNTEIEPIERSEPANSGVLPQPPENADKGIPMVSGEQQVFETIPSHDMGNVTDESFPQAGDNLETDHTMPEQETGSSPSRSVSPQDKTENGDRSIPTQQIADEIPQQALPPSPTVRPTSWTIRVSFNALDVPDEAVKDLMAEFMQCEKGLIITGHTCSLGDSDDNYYVGLARAKSVRKTLTELGISINRLKVRSESDDQPVATNATEQGRRANRRVVISCR